MTHQAILSLTAALELLTKKEPDPDHMLLPIECVNIDDGNWWHIYDARTGNKVWVVTVPTRSVILDADEGHWTALFPQEVPTEEMLDEWRVS